MKVILDDCSGAKTPQDCLCRGQPTRLFNTVQKALLSVVDLVQKNIPGTPVFVHSYDYANPNGVGFLGLGQWLQYPMLQCGVPLKLHQPLINLIIDQFWESLQRSQAQAPNFTSPERLVLWNAKTGPTSCTRPLMASTVSQNAGLRS